jgi:hypothetical protein
MDFSTGSGPEGAQGSGGSAGGPGGRPPGMTGAPGGEFDYRDPVQSFIGTVRNIVTAPVAFFRSVGPRGEFLNPLIFAAICGLISGILAGILNFVFTLAAGNQGFGEALTALVGGIVLAPIGTLIGVFIGAAITHLLVMIFVRPSNAGFEGTLRVVSYAAVTQLISWIPILGGLVALVWGIALSIFGIREIHSTTTGKAALVVLIPVAVVLLLLFLVIGAAAFFIFSQQ